MKKLMIAAAAAAMTGATFASTACGEAEIRITDNGICDDGIIAVEGEDCAVWDFAITLKTLAPKKLTCKVCESGCSDKTVITYLDNATRKLTGYVWTCDDECFEESGDINVTLWEKSTKTPVIPMYYNWVNQATGLAAQDPATFTEFQLYRYGKKANKVAAYWQLEGDDDVCPLEFIGAGVNGSGSKIKDPLFDDAEYPDASCFGLTLKSISGYAAGQFSVSQMYIKACLGTYWYPIKRIGMCECFSNWCDVEDEYEEGAKIPTYGSWSLKYNKKLSKKGASMLTLVPSYALVER